MKLYLMSFIIASLLFNGPVFSSWHAGVAKVDITPQESVPLAGYGGKTRMSENVLHPIWIKALALRDETNEVHVIVTADLVGLSEKMVNIIACNAIKRYKLKRENLILNTSHNHSCPVTEDVLWLYYEFTPNEAAVKDRYTALVYSKYNEVIEQALTNMKPAELHFEQGLAGIAVNRRRSRGSETRSFGGQVDQDVPVITVKFEGQIKAILFGYSCHTTALGGLTISGDYAGFAQLELEKSFPGAIALFIQNCGGDANPLPRIRGNDEQASTLALMYGSILAESVKQVIALPMNVLSGPIRAVMGETELKLKEGLSLTELQEKLPSLSGMEKREIEHQISQYKSFGSPPDKVKYPVQVWRFGKEFILIALTGETVVDYSLKFKGRYGWNDTWVFGYNNNLLSYIPSERVLKEGGYEGTTGMLEYGHRAQYKEGVEDQISKIVHELVKKSDY
jgi:hypothetical protein